MTKEKCRNNQKRQHYYSQFLLAWKKISRTFSKKRHILMYWQSLISFDMIGYRNHVYNVKWKIFRVLSSALYEKEIFSMRYSHQRELILREVLSRSDYPTAEQICTSLRAVCPRPEYVGWYWQSAACFHPRRSRPFWGPAGGSSAAVLPQLPKSKKHPYFGCEAQSPDWCLPRYCAGRLQPDCVWPVRWMRRQSGQGNREIVRRQPARCSPFRQAVLAFVGCILCKTAFVRCSARQTVVHYL